MDWLLTNLEVPDPARIHSQVVRAPEARFIERTNRFPANLGVTFGINIRITGVTVKNTADYKAVITHPPFKNTKGESAR